MVPIKRNDHPERNDHRRGEHNPQLARARRSFRMIETTARPASGRDVSG